MDLSKLPKLSNTQSQDPGPATPTSPATPASQEQPAQASRASMVDYRAAGAYGGPSIGADVWFSVIVGLLLIAIGFTFARFLAAKVTGQPFHTHVNWVEGPKAGTEVDYFDLEGFTAWTDMGVFLFGLVVLFEAAALAAAQLRPGAFSRRLVAVALGLTFITVALNLVVCFKFLSAGGLPIWSGLAVAFGGWILADEWRMLNLLRSTSATRA